MWTGVAPHYDSKILRHAVGVTISSSQTYATFERHRPPQHSTAMASRPGSSGTYYVRVGSFLDSTSAQAAQASLGLTGATVAGTSGAGISVVKTGTNTVLFQFDSTPGPSGG